MNIPTPTERTPTFHVRDIPVYGDALLSPMIGFSDLPFRSLCRELGSAMSYTEFVRAESIIRKNEHYAKKLSYRESERPVVFQIFGDDPRLLLEAALRAQELGPDILDVNMGCPAKAVVNRGAGVGLMRTPVKAARIFKKLSAALEVPVTGKIRLGWDDCRSYKLIARIVEENGGALIAVHGRTKEQGYGGRADWDAIAEVRAAVGIPVIGNGDVKTVADIQRMKSHTGCEAVMIGRAAIGNPWIFAGIDRELVTLDQVRRMMSRHLERNLAFYGPRLGLELFRKHAVQYVAPYRLSREMRRKLLTRETAAGFMAVLDEIHAAGGTKML
ncbi:MAG: tRNA-dihydrouridine synthase family protein [Chloroflexi bacterium]|nr:tRNA-dihydrouridine synthase family protein [Chloroflexota bacterium]